MTDSTTTQQNLFVTVYTKPDCVQCTATKRKLDEAGVTYELIDIYEKENQADLMSLKDMGYLAAPVVFVSTGAKENEVHWAQYQPNKIDEHILKPLGLK